MKKLAAVTFAFALLFSVSSVAAQDVQEQRSTHPSAVVLGGFNFERNGTDDGALTRISPSMDFFVSPRWTIGMRATHGRRNRVNGGAHTFLSAGVRTAFFPLEEGYRSILGVTRPYAQGGLSYAHHTISNSGQHRREAHTDKSLAPYAGAGILHTFTAGLGLFAETMLLGEENFYNTEDTLGLRFGVAITL